MEGNAIESVTSVPHADDMNDDTFAKHMTLRHGQSLGGLPKLTAMPGTIKAYRAFHRHLHRLAIPGQFNHVHKVKEG